MSVNDALCASKCKLIELNRIIIQMSADLHKQQRDSSICATQCRNLILCLFCALLSLVVFVIYLIIMNSQGKNFARTTCSSYVINYLHSVYREFKIKTFQIYSYAYVIVSYVNIVVQM